MSFRIIKAIFIKQLKETFKNKEVLIQIVMFPIIAIVLTNSVSDNMVPPEYFVILFASMYVGMTPIIILSSIISGEKETGSLRMLIMSNVKPIEYILGISIYVMICTVIGLIIMGITGGYLGIQLLYFVGICTLGMLVSIFIGSIIGIVSKNQMAANSLAVPAMMICAFVPMLSMFNESIKKFGSFLFTQQINNVLTKLPLNEFPTQAILIILANLFVFLIIYIRLFRKRNLLA
ncbi:ABC transporter permease [Candidatus Stoquefichus massiliensis]|uniref:ABC transporter permease n=1 Tax=Candidatus Stoquefichus massiliensis TaxID=1470350 RepID=UPI000483825D|nr:ABC transporter permease [Candidatus Stoquefichus massiliensis]